MIKFVTTRAKSENASINLGVDHCVDQHPRLQHQRPYLKQRCQQYQQQHQVEHQPQISQRYQQQHQLQQPLQQHQQKRNQNNCSLDSLKLISFQPQRQQIRKAAHQQSKKCIQQRSQKSNLNKCREKKLPAVWKQTSDKSTSSNRQSQNISKMHPGGKCNLRMPTVGNNLHQNVDGEGKLKSFDDISETDSGIASNGTISEAQTPDCSDSKYNQSLLLSYPNQTSDIKCNDENNLCEVGSYNYYNISKFEPTKKDNSNDEESCKNSTLSKFNNSQNLTLIKEEPPDSSKVTSATNFCVPDLIPSKINFHPTMTDFNSNAGNIAPTFQNGNPDGLHIFSAKGKGSNCNIPEKFSEEVSRKLTSSLSVQDAKLPRYEKSSHSSLSYLPCPVNAPSLTDVRIIKMKERQHQVKLLNTINNINSDDTNDIKEIFTVDENEVTSETSFNENLQNIHQNTLPRMRKSLFKIPANKLQFKPNSCKNDLSSTCQPKKCPAFHRAVSYDYHENSNACFKNENVNKKSFGKIGSFLSLQSYSSVKKENKQMDSMGRQNVGGFFNSLTKLFRRKPKLNESFDQQNSGTAFSLERFDFNNNVATKHKNSKNYSSDSNLNVVQSSSSSQCLNKSFSDEPNSQLLKSPLTSQYVHKLTENYMGVKSLKESLSEFVRWNSLLKDFAKTEQPDFVLKEECFQLKRSNFKRTIRNFMIHTKEALISYDFPTKFNQKVCSSCCTSFADVVACCCSILDYISISSERFNLAEMVCNVGKTFYVVVSLYPCNRNQLENVTPPSIFFEKIDLLIERSKNLAVHLDALRYMGATKLL